MSTPANAFAIRLRRAREHAGLTLSQASRVFAKRIDCAEMAGLILAKLGAMENDCNGSYLIPNDDELLEIAEVYGASAAWLEHGTEPEFTPHCIAALERLSERDREVMLETLTIIGATDFHGCRPRRARKAKE